MLSSNTSYSSFLNSSKTILKVFSMEMCINESCWICSRLALEVTRTIRDQHCVLLVLSSFLSYLHPSYKFTLTRTLVESSQSKDYMCLTTYLVTRKKEQDENTQSYQTEWLTTGNKKLTSFFWYLFEKDTWKNLTLLKRRIKLIQNKDRYMQTL